ncbi:MAG: stage III sporulation protein AB [Clostridia bacterium]|nr:stage III sporulation protein AB [Clostridia bacterium]
MTSIACIIVMGSCVLLGFMYASKYVDAEKFFYSFSMFCQQFSANLGYQQHTIDQILSQGNYSKHFVDCALISMSSNQSTERLHTIRFLNDTDKGYIQDFFASIGRSDAQTQAVQLQFFSTYASQRLIECQQESKNKGKMSQKLGIIVGLLLCILII